MRVVGLQLGGQAADTLGAAGDAEAVWPDDDPLDQQMQNALLLRREQLDAVANASKLIDDAINKIWPDPQAKAAAQATVIQATAQAAIETLRQQMSVMLAEASSPDKWTSRARPSFLYVIYLMILAAIPMGVL